MSMNLGLSTVRLDQTRVDLQTLNWDSTPSKLIPPGFSLTRASTGTYFDSAGLLQTAAINAPRGTYRYNGSSWIFDGTIVEAAATNIALDSRFQNIATYWVNAGAVLTQNQSLYIDGQTVMASAVATTVNLLYGAVYGAYCYDTNGVGGGYTVTANTEYCVSIDVKRKQGTNGFRLYWATGGFGSGVYADFDLTNEVCSTVSSVGTGSSTGTPRIENVGGGIYRCSVSGKLDAASTTGFLIPTVIKGYQDSATYTPTAGDGFHICGAQLELGNAPTSRVPTTTAAVPRSADVLTAPTSGLLVNAQGLTAMKFRYITDTNASWNALLSSYTVGEGMPLAYWGGFLRLFDGTAWRDGPAFTPASGTTYSVASTWAGSASALALNGSTASAGFDGSMSLGSTLGIGQNPAASAFPVSMVLQSLRLGTRSVTNSELGAWTA